MISCVRRSSAATSPNRRARGRSSTASRRTSCRAPTTESRSSTRAARTSSLSAVSSILLRPSRIEVRVCGFIVKFTCETALLDLLGLDYPSTARALPMRKVHRDCGSIGKRLCQPHFGVRESGVVLPPVERHQHADGLARVRSGTQRPARASTRLASSGRPLGRRAVSRRARWPCLKTRPASCAEAGSR